MKSPFVSAQGLRPNEPVATAATPPTPAQGSYATSVTGLAGGTMPNASTLLIPGSGPIVLVAPAEQIALIGSEVLLFANYKGDDDYLRIGERIEWSLGGVGHIQTTNKTQCSNMLALDFNKDKKISDRFAVTSTLHYEGTIDRGSEEQGKIPHLAGQSWVSIRSAEEGTSTVTAYAPTITDWNRRTSSATVHWIDAEWIYPRPDITKYDMPKVVVTQIKKRSSGQPCPNWAVRYEVVGGPNAGFGPNFSKVVEVLTDGNGTAAVELNLREGTSGVSTVKMTIIRPAGVDGGTKRLELHSSTVANHWSADAPLSMTVDALPPMRWNERTNWAITVANRSNVTKSSVVTLPLPRHIKLLSGTPTPNSRSPQADGGELVSWNLDFPGMRSTQIQCVLQAETNDPSLRAQPLQVELMPRLTLFPYHPGWNNDRAGTGTIEIDYGQRTQPGGTPATFATPPDYSTGPGSGTGGMLGDGYGTGTNPAAPSTPSATGNSIPAVFADKLKVECTVGNQWKVNYPYAVSVTVQNNATLPFENGRIRVKLSEHLGFLNDAGDDYQRIANGNFVIEQDYGIDPVPPGLSRKSDFFIVPHTAGNVTVTATAYGQAQGSAPWEPIDGASHSAATAAVP